MLPGTPIFLEVGEGKNASRKHLIFRHLGLSCQNLLWDLEKILNIMFRQKIGSLPNRLHHQLIRWIQRNFWTTCCTQIAKNSAPNQGPSRVCSKVLHRGGQLGYCWQQHPHLLHQVYVWIFLFLVFCYEYKLRFLTWALNDCNTN